MPDVRAALIQRGRLRCGAVLPCGSRKTLEECFTRLPSGALSFWFNTPDGNSHIEIEKAFLGKSSKEIERAVPAEMPSATKRARIQKQSTLRERATPGEVPIRAERVIEQESPITRERAMNAEKTAPYE